MYHKAIHVNMGPTEGHMLVEHTEPTTSLDVSQTGTGKLAVWTKECFVHVEQEQWTSAWSNKN